MTDYINIQNIHDILDFTFGNHLPTLFLLSAKSSWLPEHPPFLISVCCLFPGAFPLWPTQTQETPLLFFLFPFSSPLSFTLWLEVLYWFVYSLYVSWSDPSFFFSMITSFPTANLNKLLYTWILPSPDFPEANTSIPSGGKCCFSGEWLCVLLPPLSLPSSACWSVPRSPRNTGYTSLLQGHLRTEGTRTCPALLNILLQLNLHCTLSKVKTLEHVFHK